MMEYQDFEEEILSLTGIDLRLYKEKQMVRRLNILMHRLHKQDYEDYLKLLRSDSSARQYFVDYITINVTEFFRTTKHWDKLKAEIIPNLTRPYAWSMACSTGQEAYSLAICLAEQFPIEEVKVLATDIDERVLDKAKEGFYSEEEMNSVPQEWRNKYFEPVSKGYRVREELRQCVSFQKMNLLSDEFPKDVNLVACRNVLIYFTDEAKQMLYFKIRKSLAPKGVLFTGEAEQLVFYKSFSFEKICNFLYSNTDV